MRFNNENGFTLVELMVVVAISGIVLAAVYSAFLVQRQSYSTQDQVTDIQQNLRAAMTVMTREIRMAGFDPTFSHNFGLTYIGFRDIAGNPDLTTQGISAISFSGDTGTQNGVVDGGEAISYSIYDFPVANPDGNLDLARDTGGGRQLLAENITSLGLAYAYDADNDGSLDTYTPIAGAPQVIWAIDTNNDGSLDRNLDADNDGDIDAADGPGTGNNGAIAGAQIIPPVAMAQIRAVRIWLLAQSPRRDQSGFVDTKTYVVGRQVITPNNSFRHRLLETTVYCRNLGIRE